MTVVMLLIKYASHFVVGNFGQRLGKSSSVFPKKIVDHGTVDLECFVIDCHGMRL